MAKHQDLSSPYAIHPFAYSSNADPANDGSIDTTPYKGWINTGNSNLLKVRNAADTAWEDVSVAGAATAPAFGSNSASVTTYNDNAGTLAAASAHHHIGVTSLAHTSNTFSGPITLTTPGNTVGITSPGAGQLAFTATGGGGGSSTPLASASYIRTAGNYSTTSATFVDVDATNLKLTIVTGARRVLVSLVAVANVSVAGSVGAFDVSIDGTRIGSASAYGLLAFQSPVSNYWVNASFSYVTQAQTAASHEFRLMYRSNGTQTLVLNGDGTNLQLKFAVVELDT